MKIRQDHIADAIDGTRRVLKDAEKNLREKNYDIVFAACKAVLTDWAPYVYTIKHARYVFAEALKQLHNLVVCKDLPQPLKGTLFDYVFQLYKSPDIKDYQYGKFWTDAFTKLAPSTDHLQMVATLIDTKLKKASEYSLSVILLSKAKIILIAGSSPG